MPTFNLDKLWQAVIAASPGIVLAIFLLVVGYFSGRLLYALAWRLLKRLKFDDAASRAGVAEGLEQAGFKHTPSRLMAGLIFWATLLSFILLALEAVGLDAVLLPLQSVISYLPRLLAAGVALVAGLLLAQVAGRTAQAALIGFGIEIHETGARVVRSLVIIATVLVAIDQLELKIGVVSDAFIGLLLVIAAGIALAFALGAQGIAQNIMAGYYARDSLQSGDRVIIDGHEGILEAIGPVYSEVSQGDDIILIANQRLLNVDIRVKISNRADGG